MPIFNCEVPMKMSDFFKKTAVFIPIFASAGIVSARPAVFDIDATPVQDDKIIVSWRIPEWTSGDRGTGIYVFRDSKPIENIRGMIPVATLPAQSDSYTDSPGDFREYFYAVLFTTDPSIETQYLVNGIFYYDQEIDALPPDEKDLLLPGINCTKKGTRVHGTVHMAENLEMMQKRRQTEADDAKSYSGGLLREMPLPYMEFPGSLPENRDTGDKELGEKIIRLAGREPKVKKEVLPLYIFPEDQDSKKTSVPVKNLMKNDFEKAGKDLKSFMAKTKKDSDAYNRARFYLAECMYFTGDFASAAKEFSFMQEIYKKLCETWSRSALDLMEKPEN